MVKLLLTINFIFISFSVWAENGCVRYYSEEKVAISQFVKKHQDYFNIVVTNDPHTFCKDAKKAMYSIALYWNSKMGNEYLKKSNTIADEMIALWPTYDLAHWIKLTNLSYLNAIPSAKKHIRQSYNYVLQGHITNAIFEYCSSSYLYQMFDIALITCNAIIEEHKAELQNGMLGEAYYMRAKAYECTGDKGKADSDFKMAFKLDKNRDPLFDPVPCNG